MSADLDYVKKLARELDATVHFDVKLGESAQYTLVRDRSVHLYKDALAEDGSPNYWSALHELGHVATTAPNDTDRIERLFYGVSRNEGRVEAKAWLWALDHTYRPLDAVGRDAIALLFGGYIVGLHEWRGLPLHKVVQDEYVGALLRLIKSPSFDSPAVAWYTSRTNREQTRGNELAWKDAVNLAVAA